jgi:protein TonB
MLWRPALAKRPCVSLAVERLGGFSVGVSLLIHAAFVGAWVVWAPARRARVAETYAVEIVAVQPHIAFSEQRVAVSPPPAAPPQPPEPKKEIPPPPPKPVMVAAPPPSTPPAPPRVVTPAPGTPAPLRMAVAGAPAPQPAAVAAAAHAAPSNTPVVATAQGVVEDVADPGYVNSIRAAVAHQLRYPAGALRRGVEGRVVLRLTLTASGHLVQAAPSEPAADSALTNAALAAVRRAAPFPPWRGTRNPNARLSLLLPIRFTLDEH